MTPITIVGSPGSPYTRKMLALLRYRHLPYRFLSPMSPAAAALPKAKVPLMPILYLPDSAGALQASVDSTPLIRRLEQGHATRSVVPVDPGLAFLDELLEDYADEWLSKAMYHYRWTNTADMEKASIVLPNWLGIPLSEPMLAHYSQVFRQRQVSRLHVVGSSAATAPLIEASYRRFLAVFEQHLEQWPFWLGKRPGACDFAMHGQLTLLALFDPTPAALTLAVAPRVHAWTEALGDLTGLDPAEDDWFSLDALPDTVRALLAEVGRVHGPLLLANAAALERGQAQVQAEIDGKPWVQDAVPYLGKCLGWLRASHAALPPASRRQVDTLLDATGCLGIFSSPAETP